MVDYVKFNPVLVADRLPGPDDGEVVFAWGEYDAAMFGNNEVGRSALEVLSEDNGFTYWMSVPPPFKRMRTLKESSARINAI
jgi:hypothetical protein